MDNIKKKLLSGSIWVFIGRIIGTISGLIVNVLLTRLLEPDDVGIYYLILSLVAAFVVVAKLGLSKTVVRLIAESMASNKVNQVTKIVKIAIVFSAICSITIACFFSIGVSQWIAENAFKSTKMADAVIYSAPLVVLITFQSLLSDVFRGFHNMLLATFFGGTLTSVFSAILFFLHWMTKGYGELKIIITITIISCAISTFIAAFILLKKYKSLYDISCGPSDIKGKDILAVAIPIWITNIMFHVSANASFWILGIYQSQDAVALYGASIRLVTFVTLPLLIVNAVIPPIVAEMYTLGKVCELERIIRKITTIVSIPALTVMMMFLFLGGSIMEFIYGEFYRSGALVLGFLGIGQAVNVISGSCGIALMNTGHQKILMRITVLAGMLSLVLSLVVVKKWGAEGVAAVVAFTTIVHNLFMLYSAKRLLKIWTFIDIGLFLKYKNLLRG